MSSKVTKEEKIWRLREFFRAHEIRLFFDFDDTIVHIESGLYGKYTLLKWFWRKEAHERSQTVNDIMEATRINPALIETISKSNLRGNAIIISRNYHAVIRAFLMRHADILQDHGITLVWWVGQWGGRLRFRSREKLDFLASGSMLVADMFEDKRLHAHPRVILVQRLSSMAKWLIYFRKILKIAGFFIAKILKTIKNQEKS